MSLSNFYSRLAARRRQILSAFVLIWILAGLVCWSLPMNMSSRFFLPDSSASLQHTLNVLELSPFSRYLFVNISGAEPTELAKAASQISQALSPWLKEPEPSLFMPSQLMPLLPYLVNEEELNALNISSQSLTHKIEELKTNVAGFINPLAVPWLAADPLEMRQILLNKALTLSPLPANDSVLGYPLSQDKKNLLLVLQPAFSAQSSTQVVAMIADLNQLKLDLSKQGLKFIMAGSYLHGAANATTIQSDIEQILLFSLLGFILIYLVFIRSLGAIWLVITPLAASSLALGVLLIFWPSISGLALGFGLAMLGLAEDYAVHSHFALRSSANPALTLSQLSLPLTQAMFINVLAFAVLLFSAIPAVRQLAAFAGLTLIFGLFIALIIIPLCPWSGSPSLKINSFPIKTSHVQSLRIYIYTVLMLLSGAFLLYHSKIEISPLSFGANMPAIQADNLKMQEIWGKVQAKILVVTASDLDTAQQRLEQILSYTGPSISLASLLPSLKQQEKNLQTWNSFVNQNHSYISELFPQLAEKSDFKSNFFQPFLDLLTAPTLSLTLQKLEELGLGSWVNKLLLYKDNTYYLPILLNYSLPELPLHMNNWVINLEQGQMQQEFTQALLNEFNLLHIMLILLCVTLYFYFRDFKKMFLAMAPALSALVVVLLYYQLQGLSLDLGAVVSLPLVVGLATDHGIMLTHELVEKTGLQVKRAMLVSSLTSITSIGVLAFASHPILHSMGVIILLGLLTELLVSLKVLPWLYGEIA